MSEIKKLTKHEHNWAVFKDGVQVDALVTIDKVWRLWKDNINYAPEERKVINDKLEELNGL